MRLTCARARYTARTLLPRAPGFYSDLPFALLFALLFAPLGFVTGIIFSGSSQSASPGKFGRCTQRETALRPCVVDERSNLHELDGGAHPIEAGYALEQLLGEERLGSVF